MKKRPCGLAAVATVAMVLMVTAGIYAATAPDEIKMESPYEHKRSIAIFTHKKHVQDYKIACGDCHHDEQGKPLNDLKDGDSVRKCFECHNKPGELKGKAAKGMSGKALRAYHANAVHDNCVDCHKAYNKENKQDQTKAAPSKCNECHPKPKHKKK
ncbi:MAG: cytochrome c3 family protein [Desulfatitalea sp.]|nr:cytochrome c family protein [Desulfatitalea sp.]NNJ99519.1 cytochrome c3 family protein [Desulfatitalea sp.]